MRVSTAALIWSGDELLLVKRPPGGDLSECWELPGGKVDGDETPEEALQRELKEELGVDCTVHTVVAQSGFEHRGEEFQLLAYRVSAPVHRIELKEHTAMQWCTAVEALGLHLAPSDRDLLLIATGRGED